MEQTLPPPPAVGHSEAFGGWSEVGGEICGNLNEAYGKPYLRYVSLCYTHRFCVKLTDFLNLADSEYLHICESPESVRSILC